MNESQSLEKNLSDEIEGAISRLEESARLTGFRVSRSKAWRISWLSFVGDGDLAQSGWKFHVSAAYSETSLVIEAYGQALIALACPFKIPSNARDVSTLNSGLCGSTQIGKVITAYPASISRLKEVLHALPTIPKLDITPTISGEPYSVKNPRVHVRFGQIRQDKTAEAFDALGRPSRLVRHPEFGLVSDQRTIEFVPSHLLEAAGIEIAYSEAIEWDDDKWLSETRCLPAKILASSAKAQVYLGLNLESVEPVILKKARSGAVCDAFGNDALKRMKNEIAILRKFAGSSITPGLIFADEKQGVLAMRDLGGTPLDQLTHVDRWKLLPQIAFAIADIHEAGIVHRDVKLANFLKNKEASISVVDFELSSDVGSKFVILGGTNGSVPPEGTAVPAEASYDVVGLASILFHCATNSNPALLPGSNNQGRQRAILSWLGMPAATALHNLCGSYNPRSRPPARKVGVDLQSLVSHTSPLTTVQLANSDGFRRRSSRYIARQRSKMLADSVSSLTAIDEFAIETDTTLAWTNVHTYAGHTCFGLNLGSGGICLALLVARRQLGISNLDDKLRRAATWLIGDATRSDACGLFTGQTGGLFSAIIASTHLQDQAIFAAAKQRFLDLSNARFGGADLFSGAAGYVLACSILNAITRDKDFLLAGTPLAAGLMEIADCASGLPLWKAEKEYDEHGQMFMGAAHGAIGILLALLSLAEASRPGIQSDRMHEFGRQGLIAIVDLCLAKDPIALPETLDGLPRAQRSWCHGLGGLIWSLCQVDQDLIGLDKLRILGETWVNSLPLVDNPTTCHGFAGSMEILRLLAARTGDNSYRNLERYYLLLGEATKIRRRGLAVWTSEEPVDVTPDLWVGFTGLAVQNILSLRGSDHSVLSARALGFN